MSGLVMEFTGASRGYRDATGGVRWAVRDVSWSVEEGARWGLVGENGAGKSTLARLALGIERPDEGQVVVCGLDARGRASRRRWPSLVQIVWQDPLAYLNPYLTVEALVEEVLASGAAASDRRWDAATLLDLVGIPASMRRRRPHELSGGQCQRVALARALAPRPRVVILDEALTGLDLPVQLAVLETLRTLHEATGGAFVFVSHDLPLVRHACSHVAVMADGRLVEAGPIGAVVGAPAHAATRRLLEADRHLQRTHGPGQHGRDHGGAA